MNALSRSHFKRGRKGKLLHSLDTIDPLVVLSEEDLGLIEIFFENKETLY
jgi:hypothetical protein